MSPALVVCLPYPLLITANKIRCSLRRTKRRCHARPEMCFELGFAGDPHLNPFYWRNDYVGIEEWSRFIQEGNYCYHPQLHEQHEAFAKTWDRNLRSQGFAEVFTDKCIRG